MYYVITTWEHTPIGPSLLLCIEELLFAKGGGGGADWYVLLGVPPKIKSMNYESMPAIQHHFQLAMYTSPLSNNFTPWAPTGASPLDPTTTLRRVPGPHPLWVSHFAGSWILPVMGLALSFTIQAPATLCVVNGSAPNPITVPLQCPLYKKSGDATAWVTSLFHPLKENNMVMWQRPLILL